MHAMKTGFLLASLAAAMAAPVLAQATEVSSGTTAEVQSSAGIPIVSSSEPTAPALTNPLPQSVRAPTAPSLIAEHSSTTRVMGAGAAPEVVTTTERTYVNAPINAEHDPDVQRHLRLR